MTFSSVKELLSDRQRWYQGYYATTECGSDVEAGNPKAVKWCLIGAMIKVYSDGIDQEVAEEKLKKVIGENSIVGWNDASNRTYDEVMDAVTKAGI